MESNLPSVSSEVFCRFDANVLFVSKRFVYKIRAIYRQSGDVTRARRRGRQRLLSGSNRSYAGKLNPMYYLGNGCNQMQIINRLQSTLF